MGKFHNFSSLQGFAIKLAKFKQATLIDQLVDHKLIDESLFKFQKEGACAAYCLMWLYLRFNSARLNQLNRSKGKMIDEINLKFAKIGVSTQAEYTKNWVSENWHQHNIDTFAKYGLKFELETNYQEGFNVLLGKAASVLKWRPGAYISLDQKNKNGHAIAMFKSKDNKYYFFDPDIGEYEILNLSEFLKTYIKLRYKAFGVSVIGGHYAAISDSDKQTHTG